MIAAILASIKMKQVEKQQNAVSTAQKQSALSREQAAAKAADGRQQMNPKPLFISSLIAAILAAMALEGGALSFGQAVAILAPTSVLAAWNFTQTDWYEPAEGGEESANDNF